MSKIAIKTAWVALFIVGLVVMYGYGFKTGKNAQLTIEGAMEIAKNQYKCEMTKKWFAQIAHHKILWSKILGITKNTTGLKGVGNVLSVITDGIPTKYQNMNYRWKNDN